MNDKEYKDWSNQQKPSKKKKWIIISLSVIILIMLGFLVWVYVIIPAMQQIYQQGQIDLVAAQTTNMELYYFDEFGAAQVDKLIDICQAFTGGQQ